MRTMKVGKKECGLFMMLTAATAFLILVAASVSAVEGPAVMITNYTVEPAVLMPGDTGTITVRVQNMDTRGATTLTETSVTTGYTAQTTTTTTISAVIDTIRLISRSREIEWLQEGTTRAEYFRLGALGPGESITLSIPIKAGAYAPDGTYFPELYIDVSNGEDVRYPIPVRVDRSGVEVMVKDLPSPISVSESKQIAFVVANNRPNVVNGVTISVRSSLDAVEFKPDRVFIGNVEAYGQRVVNFTLTPPGEGASSIIVNVAYRNGENVHQSEFSTSIVVKSSSDVKLILVHAPEFVVRGEVARLDFDVANGMTKDIKAVSIVPRRADLRLFPSEYFIGDMEVGDIFSASFDLHTSNLEVGELTIPFAVVFKDSESGREYELSGYTVRVEVREPQRSGLQPLMLAGALIALLVVILIIFWLRTRRRRTRELRLSAKKA